MPVNPNNRRRRAALATANDKVVINGVTYGTVLKLEQHPVLEKLYIRFYYYTKPILIAVAKPLLNLGNSNVYNIFLIVNIIWLLNLIRNYYQY